MMLSLAAMVLSRAALALLSSCAPFIGAQTMTGLIDTESGWHQFAIADVDAKAAYCVPWSKAYPCDYSQAVSIANALLAQHHSISVGYSQVNTVNWDKYGLNAYNAFNGCLNVSVGADILSKDYQVALLQFSPGDSALSHALSMYNSGRFFASMGYASTVMAAARETYVPFSRVDVAPPWRETRRIAMQPQWQAYRSFVVTRKPPQQSIYKYFLPVKSTARNSKGHK